MKIRFLQYNVASCHDHTKPGHPVDVEAYAHAISNFRADIVTLNEVDCNTERSGKTDQLKIISENLGMNGYFAKAIELQGGAYGIALMSKYPILEAETIRIPDPADRGVVKGPFESRVILSAVLDTGKGKLRVLGSHFGLMQSEKESAARTLFEILDKNDLPLIFSGDLNLTPDTPIIQSISARLSDTVDSCRYENIRTFPSYDKEGRPVAPEHPDVKIDYVFTTSDIKHVSAGPMDFCLSDHLPYFCTLEFPEV